MPGTEVGVETLSGTLSTSLASTVKGYHVNRAIEFYNKNDVYFAFGHEAEWDTEGSAVPSPDYYDEIQEIWGYKRVETKYLVVPDEVNGTVSFQNKKFRIVAQEKAHEENARWLYLMSYVSYDELPTKTYRQVGVVTGLTLADPEGMTSTAFTPDKVGDPGHLEILNNRVGIGRESDMREMVSILIEF